MALKLSAKLFSEGPTRQSERERQEEQVKAAAASDPPEFGMEENFFTASESLSSDDDLSEPQNSQPGLLKTSFNKAKEILFPKSASKGSSMYDTSENLEPSAPSPTAQTQILNTNTSHPSIVVPIKTIKPTTSAKSVDNSGKATLESVRSAFANTSIYDSFDNVDETKMPGSPPNEDDSLQVNEDQNRKKIDIDKMVKKGELMPRWQQEAAFWDFYGNKLQVNGTKEGVLELAK